jgi:hypothetical protein
LKIIVAAILIIQTIAIINLSQKVASRKTIELNGGLYTCIKTVGVQK